MTFKNGVKINGVKPEVSLALIVANDVFKSHGYDMIVTSITDGKHSPTSLHYVGFAFDLRNRHIETLKETVLIQKDLREALTDEFDVILEKDHFHIEFDEGKNSKEYKELQSRI